MRRGITRVIAALTIIIMMAPVLAHGTGAQTPSMIPGAPRPDPDIPPATAPAAEIVVFDDERFAFSEGTRTRTVTVPDAEYDRVILTFSSRPDGDPWDRLFAVGIAGLDVLHGATPRTTFTLEKDVTRFAPLMPPGENVSIQLYMASWVGALHGSVTFSFYVNEPTATLVEPPADSVHPVRFMSWLRANGQTHENTIDFGTQAARAAELRITLSGHGNEEFWYLDDPVPRTWTVQIDGSAVGTVETYPWVYALLGFSGGSTAGTLNKALWWSWHPVADKAGLHWGDGEIPAYRIAIADEHLHLLSGERTVSITGAGQNAHGWSTSYGFTVEHP